MDYDINPKYLKIIYGIMKLEFYIDIQKIRRVNPPYPSSILSLNSILEFLRPFHTFPGLIHSRMGLQWF